MMRVLGPADYRTAPWKNGGGRTTEMFVWPPGASLDAFDARVSMADVAADGAFSLFPGVDRTLTVLSGDGVELQTGSASPTSLTPATEPHSFAGDLHTQARLLGGAVVDLNVMTRRDRLAHRVTRLIGDRTTDADEETLVCLGFCARGPARCETSHGAVILEDKQCVVLEGGSLRAQWRLSPPASVIWIEIGRPARA